MLIMDLNVMKKKRNKKYCNFSKTIFQLYRYTYAGKCILHQVNVIELLE